MQLRNDQLAERILEAAKSEFLEKGYRQASVRSIAASVGVTTGALYRYYANKEALFDALVSGPADYLYDQCKSFSEAYSRQELDEQLANLPELTRNSDGGTSDFLKYIYQNKIRRLSGASYCDRDGIQRRIGSFGAEGRATQL